MKLKRLCAFPALLTSMALAACTTVGPQFSAPAAPTAGGYAMAGERGPAGLRLGALPAGAWWRAFGSPELDAVMARALADSPTLAAADARLAAAREATNAIAGARLPQLDATASAIRQKANLKAFGLDFGIANPTFSLYSLGGQVSYDLDLFGGRRRRLEESAAQSESLARRGEAAALTLTGQVARQALTVAALRAQLAAVDQVLADDQRLLDLTQRAFKAGGVPRSQTVDAASQLAADQALSPPLRRQLAAARHQLALLVGQAPGAWSPPDFDIARLRLPATLPVSLPSQLVRRRPDILAAEANLHAATAEIGVRTAAQYPNVVLNASLAQAALDPGSLFSSDFQGWSFGPSLTAPLFHGGALAANRRAAIDEANASLADYKQTVLGAFVQVSDVLQALSEDAEQIAAAERASAAAEESRKLADLGYREGGRDLLQFIDAERQAARARLDLVRARAQQYLDAADLFVATAADWTAPPTASTLASR